MCGSGKSHEHVEMSQRSDAPHIRFVAEPALGHHRRLAPEVPQSIAPWRPSPHVPSLSLFPSGDITTKRASANLMESISNPKQSHKLQSSNRAAHRFRFPNKRLPLTQPRARRGAFAMVPQSTARALRRLLPNHAQAAAPMNYRRCPTMCPSM